MTMDLEAPLFCPFCGASAPVALVPYNQVHHSDDCDCFNDADCHWVVNCNASGTSSEGYAGGCGAVGGAGVTKREAIDLWNQRYCVHSASGD